MIKQYDVYNLDLENSKRVIIEELKEKGRTDIKILSCKPITLGIDNGFSIKVSFEAKSLDLADIINIKQNIFSKSLELENLDKKRKKIENKIEEITCNCKHEIVVEISDNHEISGTNWQDVRCLICGRKFLATEFFPLENNKFKNIIYFNNDNNLSDDDKMNISFKLFYEEKSNNPQLSDQEIVETINKRINEKNKVKEK